MWSEAQHQACWFWGLLWEAPVQVNIRCCLWPALPVWSYKVIHSLCLPVLGPGACERSQTVYQDWLPARTEGQVSKGPKAPWNWPPPACCSNTLQVCLNLPLWTLPRKSASRPKLAAASHLRHSMWAHQGRASGSQRRVELGDLRVGVAPICMQRGKMALYPEVT